MVKNKTVFILRHCGIVPTSAPTLRKVMRPDTPRVACTTELSVKPARGRLVTGFPKNNFYNLMYILQKIYLGSTALSLLCAL